MMVALFISGKESVNMNNIDTFLCPLVDELMMLWRLGVQVMDFGKLEGRRSFTLHGMVMWTIKDFLGYGLLFKCVHQGYVACPKCGPQTTSQHSSSLRKLVYMGHCRWLWSRHPYRFPRFNNAFDGIVLTFVSAWRFGGGVFIITSFKKISIIVWDSRCSNKKTTMQN